jgi:hypothetical protein
MSALSPFNFVRFLLGALFLTPFACRAFRRANETEETIFRLSVVGSLAAGAMLFTGINLQQIGLVSILTVSDLLRRGREFASESFLYFRDLHYGCRRLPDHYPDSLQIGRHHGRKAGELWQALSRLSRSETSPSFSAASGLLTMSPSTSSREKRLSLSGPALRRPAAASGYGPDPGRGPGHESEDHAVR